MGWRFRKSVSPFPGVRFNLSRSGVSTSIGRPGMTVNLGHGQRTVTMGIPGTGLSHVSRFAALNQRSDEGDGAEGGGDAATAPPRTKPGCGCVSLILASLLAFGILSKGSAPTNTSDSAFTNVTDMASDNANAPNRLLAPERDELVDGAPIRARPGSGRVVRHANADAPTRVLARRGAWTKVAQAGAIGWVASKHVRASRTGRAAATGRQDAASASSRQLLAPSTAPRASRNGYRTNYSAIPHAALPHRARRPARRASRFYDNGGECPCGSGRICIGPRGGRFCITSGGNKEYGQ